MKKFFKTKLIHKDKRGDFKNIINDNFANLSIIFSKEGTIRSNHYHIKDSHCIYVISGKMDYYYKKLNKNSKIFKKTLVEGDIVYTPSLEIHATVFTEDTRIIVASKNPRSKKFYEKDTKPYILV